MVVKFPAIISKKGSWSTKICNPVFEDSSKDISTFLTWKPDSNTISCCMVNQVKYFMSFKFLYVHSYSLVEVSPHGKFYNRSGCRFLYLMQVWQVRGSFIKMSINSASCKPALLTRSHNFFALGWLNCLCNLVAILNFSTSPFLSMSFRNKICRNLPRSDGGLDMGTW